MFSRSRGVMVNKSIDLSSLTWERLRSMTPRIDLIRASGNEDALPSSISGESNLR